MKKELKDIEFSIGDLDFSFQMKPIIETNEWEPGNLVKEELIDEPIKPEEIMGVERSVSPVLPIRPNPPLRIPVSFNNQIIGPHNGNRLESGAIYVCRILDYADDVDDFADRYFSITLLNNRVGVNIMSQDYQEGANVNTININIIDKGFYRHYFRERQIGAAYQSASLHFALHTTPFSRLLVLQYRMVVTSSLTITSPWLQQSFNGIRITPK